MISLIVAKAENDVIGSSNELPWYLPKDLKHFSQITTGHTVIMGRKTYDSIIARIGKPLPNRKNVIITKQAGFIAPDCVVVNSLEDAVRDVPDQEEVFIIGGAQIYKEALPMVDRLYITHVHAEPKGDILFPEIDLSEWEKLEEMSNQKDEKHFADFTWAIYDRKK
jgi:dihydrofolate reductase